MNLVLQDSFVTYSGLILAKIRKAPILNGNIILKENVLGNLD